VAAHPCPDGAGSEGGGVLQGRCVHGQAAPAPAAVRPRQARGQALGRCVHGFCGGRHEPCRAAASSAPVHKVARAGELHGHAAWWRAPWPARAQHAGELRGRPGLDAQASFVAQRRALQPAGASTRCGAGGRWRVVEEGGRRDEGIMVTTGIPTVCACLIMTL
jgi:hypothetical protein